MKIELHFLEEGW